MTACPAESDSLVAQLREAFGDDAVLTEASDREPYETGWRYGHGRALAVVRPRTTEEVARALVIAKTHGVRVHPIGANTGLVGASNPDAGDEPLVISLERLAHRIEIDPVDRSVLVDAGVTLGRLNEALEPHGLFFPIDLGADPQVGGMIATNTGGTRFVKYGDVRANLLGIEVVLADGTVVNRLRRLRKDNTGLDLKQLFVGTSGAFGLITRAVLRVAHRPRQRTGALVAIDSGETALALLANLERTVGDSLTAFEVISRSALEITLRHGADVRDPFPSGMPPLAILIEITATMTPKQLDLEALLAERLGEFMEEREGILDAVLGNPEDFWRIRHQISESLRHEGHILALDLSVPRSRLAEFTRAATELLAETHPFVAVCDFGHWGDGGTHFNLLWDPDSAPRDIDTLTRELQDRIYDLCVREFEGSFSAEHGVGPHNQRYYERYVHPVIERVHAALRRELDPEERLGRPTDEPTPLP
jgi:FAD/FMN-containing dehydrogenase